MTKNTHTKKLIKPEFTIVTITLNNVQGLRKTFESIKDQEFRDFEWLVIDGGSTDESAAFLQKQKSDNTHEFYIRYTSEPDDGIYDAMNKGIKHAYGHYLIFMNAGDQFAEGKTLKTIAAHTQKRPDFIYGDALETTKNRRKPIAKTASRYKDLPWGMFTHHQAMLYNRKALKALDIHYSQLYTIASDYDFTARFLAKVNKIVYIRKSICIFEHGGISQKQAFKGRREQYLSRERLEMVSIGENVMIFLVQSISWTLKTRIPWLHVFLRALRTKK
jgi:putative colanic acid biosynthesis glycosyltransferase